MTNDKEKIELSQYKEVQVISKKEKCSVSLVINTEQSKLAIKKCIYGNNADIYYKLKDINNEHIPKIYMIQEDNDCIIEIEEYIEGVTLQDILLDNDTVAEDKVYGILKQLCDALKQIHSLPTPIIHRDIKPSNIILASSGVLKLIDFDASREYKLDATKDTICLGTIEYAAPEQFGYSQTDVRSDIYAVGMLLAEFMKKADKDGVIYKHRDKFNNIINKCTMFDPNQRYQNINELENDALNLRKFKNKRIIVVTIAITLIVSIICSIMYGKTRSKKDSIDTDVSDLHSLTNISTDSREKESEIALPSAEPELGLLENTKNLSDIVDSATDINKDFINTNENKTVTNDKIGSSSEDIGNIIRDTTSDNQDSIESTEDKKNPNAEKPVIEKPEKKEQGVNDHIIDAYIANNNIDYYKNAGYSEDIKIYVVYNDARKVEYLSLLGFGHIDKKNYTVDSNVITLKKEYLNSLPNNYYDLFIGFDKGNTASMQFEVHNGEEESKYGEYRLSHYNKIYYTSKPEDFVFLVYNINDANIIGLWNGTTKIEEQYYKIEDNGYSVVLYKDYMEKLEVGSIFSITIELDNGVKKDVSAQILEKAIIQPSLESAEYHFYKSSPEDILIKVIWNEAKQITEFITTITENSVVSSDYYSFTKEGVIVRKEAFVDMEIGKYEWVILFDTGYGNSVKITVLK